jgi:hypothetical protein
VTQLVKNGQSLLPGLTGGGQASADPLRLANVGQQLSEIRRGADTEFVAFRIGHDNVIVTGILLMPHDRGPQAG